MSKAPPTPTIPRGKSFDQPTIKVNDTSPGPKAPVKESK
jgi:hypothetical protein